MVLSLFRRSKADAAVAEKLYRDSVARAREPVFFMAFAVPDTIDGRFDLLTLHVFLVMEALKGQDQTNAGAKIGTALADLTFAGFDQALRNLGVSDFGLSRRIKTMADAFYGRLGAYRAAGGDRAALAAAIHRNLYRGEEGRNKEAARLAHYVIAARAHMAQGNVYDTGRADFGPLPDMTPSF